MRHACHAAEDVSAFFVVHTEQLGICTTFVLLQHRHTFVKYP